MTPRTIDIEITGSDSGLAGYAAYCSEVGLGIMYSEDRQQGQVIFKLLRRVGENLGMPVCLGQVRKITRETTEPDQLITDDRRIILPPKPKAQRKAKPQWKQEEWGSGWKKGQ